MTARSKPQGKTAPMKAEKAEKAERAEKAANAGNKTTAPPKNGDSDALPPAQPILKWAGGKSRLLREILPRLPDRIDTYYEPFLGGAAVFFALARERRFKRAVLADTNEELANMYRALQEDVDGVIRHLKRYRHSEDEYYRVREARPRSMAGKAARVIYLNRTGYNGLYRVNGSGKFNVPFGRYKKPNFCNEPRLRAASDALQDVEIRVGDFESACRQARSGDAVYLDPPYVPRSPTANFAHYQRAPFGPEQHQRLAGVFGELSANGISVVLSNSDTPETRELYEGWSPLTVNAPRLINSRAERRGSVTELLVVGDVERRGYAAAPASSS
jgi:DNA adenine methylase